MRYIDADALMEKFRDASNIAATSERYDMAYGFKIAISMVNNAPTCDVAPVVRCKDCKYAIVGRTSRFCSLQGNMCNPIADDFYCGCGARMDGGDGDAVDE